MSKTKPEVQGFAPTPWHERWGICCSIVAVSTIIGLLSLWSGDNYWGCFAIAAIFLRFARIELRDRI